MPAKNTISDISSQVYKTKHHNQILPYSLNHYIVSQPTTYTTITLFTTITTYRTTIPLIRLQRNDYTYLTTILSDIKTELFNTVTPSISHTVYRIRQ